MTHIKKLVMHGFKSFAKKTELPLTSDINVVIGPNGSGKSNVADAICFVLGRLGTKSMRVEKAKNLIFAGTKVAGPAKEAIVEIVFDNEEKTFSLENKEVSIKRILRKNGQSIYKINNKTTTRQEILALLAQADIDPNGFNIVLQNEIQNFAAGSSEDRRKILEEVAGISMYELRKEKSIKELEKTSQKLKEIEAVLRERTTYMNALEKDREVALRKKNLEENQKRYKASLIYNDLTKRKKENEEVKKQIEIKEKEIEKQNNLSIKYQKEIEKLENKIKKINKEIQKQTGFEQEQLNKEISDLRAEIAVLKVKIENHQKKITDISRQKENFQKIIEENETSIKNLIKESPTVELIRKELEKKKKQLEFLEEEKKQFYTTKTELRSINEILEDKKSVLQNYKNESDLQIKQVTNLTIDLFDKKTTFEKLENLKENLIEKQNLINNLNNKEREIDKKIHTNEFEIKREQAIVEKIEKLDTCPLCKNKITPEHIKNINDEINPKIISLKEEINNGEKELTKISQNKEILNEEIKSLNEEIQKRTSDLIKLKSIFEKEEQIKILQEKILNIVEEIKKLDKKQKSLSDSFDENSNVEEKYEKIRLEIEEISIRSKENLDSEIQYKQKELDRAKISINQLIRDEKHFLEEIEIVEKSLTNKEEELNIKRKKEEELRQKAEKFIKERDLLHEEQRNFDRELATIKTKIHNFENELNNLKVENARIDAQIQNLETDMLDYPEIKIIKLDNENLKEKLRKVEETLSRIGNVNMRALETYEEIKKEYDSVKDKLETIRKEKEKIISIIHKIDVEKKKVFLGIVEKLNINFERNFTQMSQKGRVYLEVQNKKDPFSAGIDVILKTGHGKYFDIKSLSGGEKTLVALALIFAIQELKPYSFYLLDEIDAALDKRNANRLATFLQKYARKGQYIVISHNDEIIANSQTLYGVSMHDGISKLTTLKV